MEQRLRYVGQIVKGVYWLTFFVIAVYLGTMAGFNVYTSMGLAIGLRLAIITIIYFMSVVENGWNEPN